MWKNSTDLLSAIHEAHERLRNGETDATTANAEARLLGAATKTLGTMLEHARLTLRLQSASDLLPEFTFKEVVDPPARRRASK
jgi:hypothetical protein